MKKILLVIDVKGWAWERNALNIKKNLSNTYDISIITSRQFHAKLIEEFDSVHFMGWTLGRNFAEKVSGGVCSHNWELLHYDMAIETLPKFNALTVNNKILESQISKINPNVYYVANGVDEKLFNPLPYPKSDVFTVGWLGKKPLSPDAGMRKEDSKTNYVDIKGYNLVLKKLIKELEPHGVKFKMVTATHKDCISFDLMPKWYEDVNCQLNCAYTEGTPNPLFEAASCARPVISTRSGAIAEFINHDNGRMVETYSEYKDIPRVIGELKDSILELKNDLSKAEEMGRNARKTIEESWTWRDRSKQFIPLFERL